jgi:hypothetical protein
VSYTRNDDGIETGSIEAPDHHHRLFRIKEQREVRVSLTPLRRHWNEERINRFVQKLVKIDPRFQIDTKRKGERPEAPLESLAQESKREQFQELMDQVLTDPDRLRK